METPCEKTRTRSSTPSSESKGEDAPQNLDRVAGDVADMGNADAECEFSRQECDEVGNEDANRVELNSISANPRPTDLNPTTTSKHSPPNARY
jgi:hypothetical protein